MRFTGSLMAVFAIAAAAALTPAPAQAQSAKAALKDASGKDVGSAELSQTPAGVMIKLMLKGAPAGERAFHIHAVGKCEPPFASAGGHFNPGGKKHGVLGMGGHHAGDMPNLHVPVNGQLTIEVLNSGVTLERGKPNSLFHEGGTAIVIHAGKDDYKSDPAGDAGGRIICGAIM